MSLYPRSSGAVMDRVLTHCAVSLFPQYTRSTSSLLWSISTMWLRSPFGSDAWSWTVMGLDSTIFTSRRSRYRCDITGCPWNCNTVTTGGTSISGVGVGMGVGVSVGTGVGVLVGDGRGVGVAGAGVLVGVGIGVSVGDGNGVGV